MELLHGCEIQPVRRRLNRAIGIVGDLRAVDTATLMVLEGLQMHQVVVLSEEIGMSLEIGDAGVITTIALSGRHQVVLFLPGTQR